MINSLPGAFRGAPVPPRGAGANYRRGAGPLGPTSGPAAFPQPPASRGGTGGAQMSRRGAPKRRAGGGSGDTARTGSWGAQRLLLTVLELGGRGQLSTPRLPTSPVPQS